MRLCACHFRSVKISPPATKRQTSLEFLGELGQAALHVGNAVPLVERDLAIILKANGEPDVKVFELPTALFLIWESGDEQQVDMAHGAHRIAPLRFDRNEEVMLTRRSQNMPIGTSSVSRSENIQASQKISEYRLFTISILFDIFHRP